MSKKQLTIVILLICLATVVGMAETLYPLPGWTERPDPAAAPEEALPSQTLTEYLGPSPKSLNYYLDNNTMSAQVFGLLYESLLTRDPATLDYVPQLANCWSISEDRQTFTFWLDPNARWSDGHPVTAEDVIWTYDTLLDPKNLTGPVRYTLERLERPVVTEDGGIRFRAKSLHWENLSAASGFSILPKHAYEKLDFNLINFEFPVVSGPYRVKELQEGICLILEKRADWWRGSYPAAQGIYNFRELRMRFFEDQQNAFDAFKKGEIDLMTIYTASQWHGIEDAVAAVRNHWIVKQEIHNRAPAGMQGFAINLRRPLFQDLRVRQALAHLLDRKFMNHSMMFDAYFLHRSYMEDLYDEAHPNPNPEYDYDPAKARRLLAEAGWTVNPQTGRLEKNGQAFEFTFLNRGSANKFLAVYSEALKDVGITMNIVNEDWSAWAKDMDEYNFDMTWAAWGGSLFHDPEQLWSSREGQRKGSSNITGFADEEVDRLIEAQKPIFDIQERNEINRKIDQRIYAQVPYILLWNIDYTRLLYWNKFGTPPMVLGKFDGDASATALWWLDPDRADELAEAMEENSPLPAAPEKIYWKD